MAFGVFSRFLFFFLTICLSAPASAQHVEFKRKQSSGVWEIRGTGFPVLPHGHEYGVNVNVVQSGISQAEIEHLNDEYLEALETHDYERWTAIRNRVLNSGGIKTFDRFGAVTTESFRFSGGRFNFSLPLFVIDHEKLVEIQIVVKSFFDSDVDLQIRYQPRGFFRNENIKTHYSPNFKNTAPSSPWMYAMTLAALEGLSLIYDREYFSSREGMPIFPFGESRGNEESYFLRIAASDPRIFGSMEDRLLAAEILLVDEFADQNLNDGHLNQGISESKIQPIIQKIHEELIDLNSDEQKIALRRISEDLVRQLDPKVSLGPMVALRPNLRKNARIYFDKLSEGQRGRDLGVLIQRLQEVFGSGEVIDQLAQWLFEEAGHLKAPEFHAQRLYFDVVRILSGPHYDPAPSFMNKGEVYPGHPFKLFRGAIIRNARAFRDIRRFVLFNQPIPTEISSTQMAMEPGMQARYSQMLGFLCDFIPALLRLQTKLEDEERLKAKEIADEFLVQSIVGIWVLQDLSEELRQSEERAIGEELNRVLSGIGTMGDLRDENLKHLKLQEIEKALILLEQHLYQSEARKNNDTIENLKQRARRLREALSSMALREESK